MINVQVKSFVMLKEDLLITAGDYIRCMQISTKFMHISTESALFRTSDEWFYII